MICSFWASLALAWYFVGGWLDGISPQFIGALSAAVFVFFFLRHLFGPWSKLAAFLGLCSLGVSIVFTIYLCNSPYKSYLPGPGGIMLISTGLFLGGFALDAEKYRQWLHRKPAGPLKLKGAPQAGSYHFMDPAQYI